MLNSQIQEALYWEIRRDEQPFNLQEQTTEGCWINNYSQEKRWRGKQKLGFSKGK